MKLLLKFVLLITISVLILAHTVELEFPNGRVLDFEAKTDDDECTEWLLNYLLRMNMKVHFDNLRCVNHNDEIENSFSRLHLENYVIPKTCVLIKTSDSLEFALFVSPELNQACDKILDSLQEKK